MGQIPVRKFVLRRYYFASVILTDILLLTTLFYLNFLLQWVVLENGIIFDAGSQHTNVTLYQWRGDKKNGTGLVEQAITCEINNSTGISDFVDNPKDVAHYLLKNPCMEKIVQKVLPEKRNSTIVFLGATAGMRVLKDENPNAAGLIMANISRALNDTEFESVHKPSGNADILDGHQEGIWGWVTVNYLRQKEQMAESQQVGALDWGGASSQITFATNYEDVSPHQGLIQNVTLFNRTMHVYTTTHLCYGQMEALKRYLITLIHTQFLENHGVGGIPRVVRAPCQPKSTTESGYLWTVEELFFSSACVKTKDAKFTSAIELLNKNDNISFIGTGNVTECKGNIRLLFDKQNCSTIFGDNCFNKDNIPIGKKPMHFLAFSTYWYQAKNLNLTNNERSHLLEMSNMNRYMNATEELCSDNVETHSLLKLGEDHVQNSCFRSYMMYYLITNGYGFDNKTKIEIVDAVDEQSVGWTLGYMLQKTNGIPRKEAEYRQCRVFWYMLACFVINSLILIVSIIYVTLPNSVLIYIPMFHNTDPQE